VVAPQGAGDRVQVSVGSLALSGRQVDPAGSTARDVRVAVRPDDLVVLAPGEEPRDGNVLRGTVLVVEYHGREFAVVVQAPDGTLLHVRTPVAPQVGAELALTAPAERILV